ncbi:hypothetical protein [Paraburkholderia mimosarum]|uniref:hypothetical protein n=1 Tax=Paraburkholderia mimosarum TaxID=312026 RepID=UPI00040C4AF9|nr:hypothetical protein [Paraburkholderia mimosarum]
MSEYQYYEFAAVDRPLTAQQQAELRSRSTRATITASSFLNEYHWGDLKGNPVEWVQRYFDAHVYSANWGSCRLLLRVPRELFEAGLLRDYTGRAGQAARGRFTDAFNATDTDKYWLLDWWFNDDSGEHERFSEDVAGEQWMARLLPIRDELIRGDTRALYLGWLARLGNDELRDDAREPPLPDGLKTLTPAQTALAEFLMLDPDWLAAAAETSAPLAVESEGEGRFDPWLRSLKADEMHISLRALLHGRSQEAERTLRQEYHKWMRKHAPKHSTPPERRRVTDMASRVDVHRAMREQREQEVRDAAESRRRAERVRYLKSLLQDEDRMWSLIDSTLQRASGSAYEQAFQKLQDLAEAYGIAKRDGAFRRRLVQLMASHGKRGAWVSRLKKAGYLGESGQ